MGLLAMWWRKLVFQPLNRGSNPDRGIEFQIHYESKER